MKHADRLDTSWGKEKKTICVKASRHTLFEVKQEAGDGLAVRVFAVYNHENHT